MDQRSKCMGENDKTLRRKHRCDLCDLGFGNNFIDMIPKAQITRGKRDKLGFIEIKLLDVKRHY